MKIITKFKFLAILSAIPFIGFAQSTDKKMQRIIDANPDFYYSFENKSDYSAPTIGNDPIEFYNLDTPNGPTPEAAPGPSATKKAVTIQKENYLRVKNPTPSPDGQLINYSILFDIKLPKLAVWYSLYTSNETNSQDGNLWVREDGLTGSLGWQNYSTFQLAVDTWYRVVQTVKEREDGSIENKIYVDGNFIFQNNGSKATNKTMMALSDYFWFFADWAGYIETLDCSGLAFWGNTLTADEIHTLGGFAYEGSPFAEIPVLTGNKQYTIQAEDFDKGGPEIAYETTTPATNSYREEAVKIEAGPGESNYHLATGNGDWYNYSLYVPESRSGYDFIFWFYGQKTTGNYFNVLVNGQVVADATDVEFPTSYDDPIELSVPLTLKQGNNLITIQSTGGNLDKFEIQNFTYDYEGLPFSGTPFEIPGVFEAEHFDLGGEGVAYHDTDDTNSGPSTEVRPDAPGMDIETQDDGTINIGWTDASEWINYTVQVTENGEYDITGVVATGNANQTFYIDIDFRRVAAVFVHTLNHQTFEGFTAKNIPLTAGKHLLTYLSSGSVNIDKFIISKSISVQPQNIVELNPDFYYAFEKADYSLPTIGNDPIAFYDLETPGGPAPEAVSGPSAVKKAVTVQKNNFLLVPNPIPDPDGQLINYSMLFDIRLPKLGTWYRVYATDVTNSNAGPLWINTNGTLGWQSYSPFKMVADTWYRIVQTVKERENGSIENKVYVDGNLIHVNASGGPTNKGEMALYDNIWIFADTDGYIDALDCSGFALWGKTLTVDEVYALGDALHETPTSIKRPSAGLSGNVYAENGILKIKDFPRTASLAVYNLLGQKITTYKSLVGNVEISLPAKGIYIVKIQNSGVTSSYKVIVK
jgi:hypothetical protein